MKLQRKCESHWLAFATLGISIEILLHSFFTGVCTCCRGEKWDSNLWLAYGLAKRREGPNMPDPEPPAILEDGSINEELYEL